MAVYNVITNVDIQQQNFDGTITVIPAGTPVNTILLDNENDFSPPENTSLQKVSD